MKLKLDLKDGISVLTVGGDVSSAQIAILRAGILKLIQTGKKTVILDFSDTQFESDQVAENEIQTAREHAFERGSHVLIISKNPNWADSPSLVEALEFIQSPAFGLLALESRLLARFEALQLQKTKLMTENKRLSQDFEKIQDSTFALVHLKKRTAALSSQVRELVKRRSKPLLAETILKVSHAQSDFIKKL